MFNEQKLLETIHALPPDKQEAVVDFVEWLQSRNKPQSQSVKSLYGLWRHFGDAPDDNALQQNRDEMFQNWPAEDI